MRLVAIPWHALGAAAVLSVVSYLAAASITRTFLSVAKFADERVLPPDMPHAVLAEKRLSRMILVTSYGCALRGAPRSGVTRSSVNFATHSSARVVGNRRR